MRSAARDRSSRSRLRLGATARRRSLGRVLPESRVAVSAESSTLIRVAPKLDPRVSLATALQAQPGVYALLLGSGVSTGAGIPTGWGVVDALVRKAAAAAGGDPGEDFDAARWWEENGDGEPLGYSSLLEHLASTRAARRALLARFFEPTGEDRDAGLKVPSRAHTAIAALVRKGLIRVIVTTNFDRLIERALEAEGISPQIISTNSAIDGMEPLQHMACTVIKLHGDYASLDQRNTVDELSQYPKRTKELLARIFDEYGLVVAGWSGDWDPALVAAVTASSARRYPLYWATRSPLGEVGRTLTSRSGVQVIEGLTADEFFSDVLARVEAVESLADTPQSLAMNISRVKRALPNPTRRIELHDLFEEQLDALRTHLAARPMSAPSNDPQTFEMAHNEMVARSETLVRMLGTGIYHDRDEEHADLWVHVLQSAMRARRRQTGTTDPWWDDLQHLPALLTLTVGSAAALAAGNETTLIRLQTEPTWTDPFANDGPRPAFDALHTYRILEPGVINAFPSSGTTNWIYPNSHFLKRAATPAIAALSGDEREATDLFHRVEYRSALATAMFASEGRYFMRAADGEFLLDRSNRASSPAQWWAGDFKSSEAVALWRTRSVLEASEFDERLEALTTELQSMTRRR